MRLAFLVLLVGCTPIFGPPRTEWGNHPMEPVPAIYTVWYAEVEACWAKRGHYERVDWWGFDKAHRGAKWMNGYTDGDRIAIRWLHEENERIVKHEMSHHVSKLGAVIHWTDEYGRSRALCDSSTQAPTP